jgi:Spy/CpxP family protein refolding chaperone
MRTTATTITLAALLLGMSELVLTPAYGEDKFAQGCQLYKAKSYTRAAPLLSETVKKFPNFWPGHYYLAHTLLALGQRGAARKEYESCLTCQPLPAADIVNACQKVIASLGGTASSPNNATASATPLGESTATGAAGEVKTTEPESLRDKEHRWHIERLRKMCADKITKLQEEQKEALNEAMTKWTRGEDGSRKLMIQPDIEAAIEKDYAERIGKVKADSEREIAAVH